MGAISLSNPTAPGQTRSGSCWLTQTPVRYEWLRARGSTPALPGVDTRESNRPGLEAVALACPVQRGELQSGIGAPKKPDPGALFGCTMLLGRRTSPSVYISPFELNRSAVAGANPLPFSFPQLDLSSYFCARPKRACQRGGSFFSAFLIASSRVAPRDDEYPTMRFLTTPSPSITKVVGMGRTPNRRAMRPLLSRC